MPDASADEVTVTEFDAPTGPSPDPVAEPAKPEEPGEPDTVIGVLMEWLLFDNERMHREVMQRPGDSARIGQYVARLRALEGEH